MKNPTTLAERVSKLVNAPKHGAPELQEALRRAEELADRFADIQPLPQAMPVETYFGAPFSSSAERNAPLCVPAKADMAQLKAKH